MTASRLGVLLVHGAGVPAHEAAHFRARQRLVTGLLSGWAAGGRVSRIAALQDSLAVAPFDVDLVDYVANIQRGSMVQTPGVEGAQFDAPTWKEQSRFRCRCCRTHGRYRANVRELFGAVARNASQVRRVVERRLPEVNRYLEREEVQTSVRNFVATTIAERRPRVVVAHSLGSVVSMSALAMLGSVHEPELFVTLGSPLRLGLFLEQLDARTMSWPGKRRAAWVNVHDRSDIVTGGKGLDHVRFPGVINIAVSNGRHPHDAEYYLGHAVVGDLIWDVARGDLDAGGLCVGPRPEDLARLKIKRPVDSGAGGPGT